MNDLVSYFLLVVFFIKGRHMTRQLNFFNMKKMSKKLPKTIFEDLSEFCYPEL